jgi:hypothetical protein
MGYRLHVHKEHKIVYGNGRFNHCFTQISTLFDIMHIKQNEEAEENKFEWDESYAGNGGYDGCCDNFEMPIEQFDYIINNIPNLTDEELKEINNNVGPNEELTKEELLETFIEFKNDADTTDGGYYYFSWF